MVAPAPVVSRETQTTVRAWRHVPRADAPTAKGARVKCDLMDAIVSLAGEGILRPSLAQVAARALRGINAINAHFGYLHMLQRAAARWRTDQLAEALKLPDSLTAEERMRLVWLVIAGVEKPL
jgi:hypothetical protein